MRITIKGSNIVFILFILLLPIELLPFLQIFKNTISPSATIENGLFLMLLGFICISIEQKGILVLWRKTLTYLMIQTTLLLILLTSITSLFLYHVLGTLNGENSITASIPSIIYLGITGLGMYYCSVMFQKVEKKTISSVLNILCIILAIIGIVQIGILLLGGPFDLINDIFSRFGLTQSSFRIRTWGRISLTASEPAGSGDILCVLVLPYILSCLLDRHCIKKIYYTILAILFFIIAFFTMSSTVYMGVIIDFCMFVIIWTRAQAEKTGKRKMSNVFGAILIIGIVIVLLIKFTEIGKIIRFYLIDKVFSAEDMSTLIRRSTIFVDLYAFLHFPLTGVGNGNQGFFYNEVVTKMYSQEVLQYSEFANRINGSLGIANGGAFVPAFISGYGVCGLCLLVNYIKHCRKVMKKRIDDYGVFRHMYYIGALAFLGMATMATNLDGNFLIIFVLSIPLMQKNVS